MGEKYIGGKSVGEKSLGEYRGRGDAGFRSPLLRFCDFFGLANFDECCRSEAKTSLFVFEIQ